MKFLLTIFLVYILTGCEDKTNEQAAYLAKEWYQGKAELNSYALTQARYGELREGEAVLIFVSEDMMTQKLVKPDSARHNSNEKQVLKMNFTKKFITGIYPYSMMLSVFTPASVSGNDRTYKASCSVQEWCGQSFSQLRRDGKSYHWELHSYFEKEGEQDFSFTTGFLEDEIWTRIRINPQTLPQGKIKVIPGLFWQRIAHTEMKAEDAVATRSSADTFFIRDSTALMYTIHYPVTQRTLQIYYKPDAPYTILGWQESYPDGFGEGKKMLTTTGTLKKTTWLDYWNHNHLADSIYRTQLDLAAHGR